MVQVLTNEQFIASKTRLGNIGVAFGLVAWLGSLYVTFNPELVLIAYVALITGFLAFNIGRYNTLRFGGRPRQDEIIANSLKGLDQKYVLFNYVDGLPGSHLLLSPLGLFFIELRMQEGQISCEGDRWRAKRSFTGIMRGFIKGRLGNPTRDALEGVESIKKYLAANLGQETAATVPVDAVVVMTDPFVELSVSRPVVPVITPKDLRNHVRSVQGRIKLTNETYRQLYDLFGASRAKSLKESETRDRRKK
jgi:hypothetical protein